MDDGKNWDKDNHRLLMDDPKTVYTIWYIHTMYRMDITGIGRNKN